MWIWTRFFFLFISLKAQIVRSVKEPQITRAPRRRRNGGAVLRAKNLGDLTDHKFFSENCECRNNHRCAVLVQDLAIQWIQSYRCKTKTSEETRRRLHPLGQTTFVVVGVTWYFSGFAPGREARSWPLVTVAGGSRGPIGHGRDPNP